MNSRINRKGHKRYLTDVGIEILQDLNWIDKLSKLKLNEFINITNTSIPKSVFILNPSANRFKLKYVVKRVDFSSIPSDDSDLWSDDHEMKYFEFSALCLKQKWYSAVNL